MSDLFKKMLGHSESLFLDVLPLDPEFVPPIIQFRENEQSYVANCLKSLFDKRPGKNVFITGSPGIGKTAAVKYVLRELETSSDIFPIYINCWKKDTSYKIVCEICEQIGYKWVHNKRTDELIKSISEILKKRGAVIVFDEVDKLKESDVLYLLSEEIIKKSLILLANNEEFIINLDDRIKSRLNLDNLKFNEYNKNETEGVLKLRRDIAFVPNVWDQDAFSVIVTNCFKTKDIRQGLFLMRESGNFAETKSSKKIKIDHVNNAISIIEKFKIKDSKTFDIEEQKILRLIEKYSGKTVKDIYDLYFDDQGEMSYRTFHRKLEELEKNKMINFEGTSGRSKKIFYSKKLNEF